jgi:hypothetical protein
MEKKPNKRGQCGKNAMPKRSLTKAEQSLVERMVAGHRKMWEALLAINAWKKIK